MTEQRRLAEALRELVAASRLTRAHRETLTELANDVEQIDSAADELEAMAVSLHEQAHSLMPIRLCREAPCASMGEIVLTIGPSPWAYT